MGETRQENKAASAVISIGGVSKAFSTRSVLKNIDLEISGAHSVCLCGVNGVGKSTLLRIITGLLQPDKGVVRICGYNVGRDPEKAKSQLGVISHKSMVYPNLTAIENLSFFADLYGVKDSTTRIDKLLHDVGLFSYRFDRAGTLSRGLLQRLAIARALVHRPSVLLADEPFTGLDGEACKHLISVLSDFVNNDGTILMTTHDTKVGLKCCDRVLVLDKSSLIFDALTADIDTDSFVQDYLSYARAGI
ncbi:MAG: heme ABC exporter ATP-binding protein CcmA [Planctomycetota bacterium]|jgi:heme ABC exporter ATP-binding subunit CcmA